MVRDGGFHLHCQWISLDYLIAQAKEIFTSMSVPLMQLVGLKVQELAEDGRHTFVSLCPTSEALLASPVCKRTFVFPRRGSQVFNFLEWSLLQYYLVFWNFLMQSSTLCAHNKALSRFTLADGCIYGFEVLYYSLTYFNKNSDVRETIWFEFLTKCWI